MTRDSSPPDASSRSPSPSRRGRWLLLLLPGVLGLGGWLLSLLLSASGPGARASAAPAASVSPPAPADSPARAGSRPAGGVPSSPRVLSSEAAEREEERRQAEARLEQARFTLESYRKSTRYPPESRPISEEPDQVYPASPERKQAVDKERGELALRLKQEKVFVVGDETVRFFVGCENARNGQPLPCEVYSATVHEAPHLGQAGGLNGVPLDFNDSGRAGDELAGDGTWTAGLQPSRQGFALFEGTLRVEFHVRINGGTDTTSFFDILFTPSPPATFTGQVREAVEQGSLQLYVGLQVRKAGRYVLAGRVDDEAGVPFAYVSFNEPLEPGAREVRLTLFGALLRDKRPDWPLKLRDVEGFLLRESGDPDREVLKALSGTVYATARYAPERFSPEEWTSEERQRYLDEYGRDVEQAQKDLDALKNAPHP